MTVRDWNRLARLAVHEAMEWEREANDDSDSHERAKSYRALADKCHHRADALEAGRVLP
jgi:hypothetical protein